MRSKSLRAAHLWRLIGAAGLLSCGGAASSGASAEVSAPVPTPVVSPSASAAPTSAAPACGASSEVAPERIELAINSSQRTASGMAVRFGGITHEHYEDGGFEQLAEIGFSWGDERATEIISVLGLVEEKTDERAFWRALGHCWRIVESADDRLVVDVLAEDLGRRLPSCDDVPTASALPLFDSYYEAADGARFRAVIEYDDAAHSWRVRPEPTIIRHHAARLEWANLAQLGRAGLGLARGGPVQIALRITSTTIEAVPGENRWLGEYVAEIESACLPGA